MKIINEDLHDHAYVAELAKSIFALEAGSTGIWHKMCAFNEKLPELLESGASQMSAMTSVREDMLCLFKERLERDISNLELQEASYAQAHRWIRELQFNVAVPHRDQPVITSSSGMGYGRHRYRDIGPLGC